MNESVIEVEGVQTRFGEAVVHEDVSFHVPRGVVNALIGGSGSGKSVLLREIMGLQRPNAGNISVLGQEIGSASEEVLQELRRRIGVLFQEGALFSALTVGDNVAVPLRERTSLSRETLDMLVDLRIALSGLTPETRYKLPSELSGGMKKRAALARALALEPELLLFDEPTSGLDPITARAFDHLIRTLVDTLGITVVLVTHDLDTIAGIVDNLIVLGEGRVLAQGTVSEVKRVDHPWIKEYFNSRTT